MLDAVLPRHERRANQRCYNRTTFAKSSQEFKNNTMNNGSKKPEEFPIPNQQKQHEQREAAMRYRLGAETRAKFQKFGALIAFGAFAASAFTAPAGAAAVKDYGKPGDPIELVIGYQPYYTESWSGVIMRDKKFYEKYLPKGSNVSFQVGLQGAIIVNGMLAGKVDVGYVGDMPGIVSTSHPDVRDVRIVSVLGTGFDQCNIFLTRTDAPQFKSPEEALKWLDGKTVAVPKGSCTDRFAQAVFKRLNIKPSEYLNQSIEVITSGFRAKKLDAAVMWEPTTSRLVLEKLARKIATGASVNEHDGGF